jgi:hypothetical protein
VGANFAAVLWSEAFYRSFSNRRQVAAYAGLAATPWQSGEVLTSQRMTAIFNFACAEWGETSVPPKDLFARVASLVETGDEFGPGPNYWQCVSLANFMVGNTTLAKFFLGKAEQEIEAMPPIPVFSCWRYLNVRKKEFMNDLQEMRDQMKSRKVLLPRFLEERSLSLG